MKQSREIKNHIAIFLLLGETAHFIHVTCDDVYSLSLSVRQKENQKVHSCHQGEWHVPALKSDFSLWRM